MQTPRSVTGLALFVALLAAGCGPSGPFRGDESARLTLISTGDTGSRDAPRILARLERLGVAASIEATAPRELVVTLDGFTDRALLLEALGRAYRLSVHAEAKGPIPLPEARASALEARLVDDGREARTWELDSRAQADAAVATIATAPGTLVRPERNESAAYDSSGARETWRLRHLERVSLLHPTHVVEAELGYDPYNSPIVWLSLSEEGRQRFAAGTSANVGRRIAICLDDEVMSFPRVAEPITGGRVMISGAGGHAGPPERRERLQAALAAGLVHPLESAWTAAP